MRAAFILIAAIALAGCAGGRPNVCATARAINPRLDPAQVTISSRERGLTTSRWMAHTPGGDYRRQACAPSCAPAPKPATAATPPAPPASATPPPAAAQAGGC